MIDPPRTPDAILASWVDNATPWTEAVRGRRLESRRAATDAAIVSAVRALGVSRVLDVGCGEGWLCRALRDAGMDLTGIDGSPGLIQAAEEFAGAAFHLCTYRELIDTPLAFGRFQAAVCNFALFDRDLQPMLVALHRLLTPGGTLVIQTVHPQSTTHGGTRDGWRQESFGATGKSAFSPMPWYFRTGVTWETDLTSAGFADLVQADTKHPETDEPLSLILRVSRGSPRAGDHV